MRATNFTIMDLLTTKKIKMSFQIKGIVCEIFGTTVVSEKFQKREFVIEVENDKNPEWNDFIKFQLTQDRCDLIDKYNKGQEIEVYFNIKGRAWEKDGKLNYFSNLEAWRISSTEKAENKENDKDDLPF